MAFQFVLYTPEWEPAVARFNQRMADGNAPADFDIPQRAVSYPDVLPRAEAWLAVDDGEVRGGMIILMHDGFLNDGSGGRTEIVANFQSPLSEGIIDPKYTMISIQMIRSALKRFPHAYVVGMGHADRPVARLLKAAGWNVRPVPFFFRILKSRAALTQLKPLQRKTALRIASVLAAYTGAGAVALGVVQRKHPNVKGFSTSEIKSDSNDDAAWASVEKRISFGIVRDSQTLGRYLIPEMRRFAVHRDAAYRGWFSIIVARMRNHSYFGNLTVGTLCDIVSVDSENTAAFVELAVREARAAGCDMVVSNQLSTEAQNAMRDAGFVSYTSNYLFASSKALSAVVSDATAFVTRQDGDGLVNLRSSPSVSA